MRLRCSGELLINGMRIGGTFLLRHQLLGRRWMSSFTRFDEYLSQRRAQASKSLLIQVTNANGAEEVKDYLQSRYGKLESLYYYTIPKKVKGSPGGGGGLGGTALSYLANNVSQREHHWLLAEFSSKQSALDCISSCEHSEGTLPFQSSMLFYQLFPSNTNGANGGKHRRGNMIESVANKRKGTVSKEGPQIPTERLTGEAHTPNFKKGKTLSEQLNVLEESTKLSELGIRIRFFLASQLEQALSNLFPNGCVLPFGSTVSGIGRQSGDLDLVMVPDTREIFPHQSLKSKTTTTEDDSGKLLFHSKIVSFQNTANARYQTQKVMEIMGDMIQLFVPGCVHIQRILQARVPILRFGSDFTDLQCDLSMTNSSGVHMSELIYLMTKLEPRFPTLLFTIRAWASARKITNPVPGRQPTNFMFVLLLMYFLQQKQLLPTLDVLFNNAAAKDQRITADGIDCSFIRDRDQILKHFTPRTDQPESIAELLFDFFEFFSEFDFNSKGVSLITGNSWGKPDSGPLYIQNPLERHLNVARNVSKEEVSRFKSKAKEFLYMGKGMNILRSASIPSKSKRTSSSTS